MDVMLGREPHLRDSAAVLAAVETAPCGGLLCATTVTTIYYIAERQIGSRAARRRIAELVSIFGVAGVNLAVLGSAIELAMADFEDSVMHEAAIQAGAHRIITRNVSDFNLSSIPVYTPVQFLAALGSKNEEP